LRTVSPITVIWRSAITLNWSGIAALSVPYQAEDIAVVDGTFHSEKGETIRRYDRRVTSRERKLSQLSICRVDAQFLRLKQPATRRGVMWSTTNSRSLTSSARRVKHRLYQREETYDRALVIPRMDGDGECRCNTHDST
jgi:hypothetical protein